MNYLVKKTQQRIVITLLFTLIVLLCLIVTLDSGEIVYAETYNNFLSYSGSAHSYFAKVIYTEEILSQYSVNYFSINYQTTSLEWSIFGPNFENVKITMTRPDGSTRVYSFTNGLKKDIETITLFDKDDLLDNSGNVIEGKYTVQASGKITAGSSTTQSNSFNFYVNLSAPTVTLQTASSVVDSYTITNKEVTVFASDKDCTPTLKYSRSTNGSYPTSATTSFTSGKTFSDEGNYRIEATDGTGRKTTKYFSIDKTAPKVSLSGVVNGGYTNKNVTISWDTTNGGVGTQRINSDDNLTVSYSLSTNGNYPTSAITSFTNGKIFSDEGNYLVTIKDAAGNSSSYKFTIDKTAPKLTLNGLITDEATKEGFSANWNTNDIGVGLNLVTDSDTLTVLYGYSSLNYPTSANTTYNKNTFLSTEGYYLLTITDKTGNRSTYRVIVDQTAPTVNAPTEYLNTSFVFSAEDPRGVTIEYRHDSGSLNSIKKTSFDVLFDPENFGVWEFRAIDDVGNATSWSTVKFFYRETFGNKVNIQNAYKTPAYWIVQLSSKYFPDIAGTYSFGSYESALAFASAREWEYRVVELSGGKWSYVNISNESVIQIYDKKEDLDRAVNKYASSYISERNILGVNGSNYPNPTDEDGNTRPDALTEQNLKLPEHLSQYQGLPLYFLAHNFKFAEPVVGVTGNVRQVVFKYISNGIQVQEGEDISIDYNTAIKNFLDATGAWKQGYYLVTESDLCGNVEKYIVCIDTQLPELVAQAQFGDGSENEIKFDQGYTTENEGVMLYIGLELREIIDNLDEYVMLMISGRGFDQTQFINTDMLPFLTYENGYWGIYTLTVYDRSLNALTFVIKIAGEAPTLQHTSLTNETRCTLTIESNDPYNAITGIWLYKISYTGEYIEVKEDGDGNPISAERLSYVLRTGGKYVMRYTDIFGRTIESEPLFYMKGLPSGILSGVRENGITNKDVTFEYANTNSVELYIWQDGKWVIANELMSIVEKEGYNIAQIAASVDTSKLYKFFLFVSEDKNLFVEYRFEIDCIAPSVDIKTDGGDPVVSESVINSSFMVTWNESGIIAYYYNKNSSLGELGQTKYTKETIINTAGTWVFNIYDEVGNSIYFTVTLDNAVSYELGGTYSQLDDGTFITRNYITVSVTEPTTVWEVESTNSIKPSNGQRIDVDGTYTFRIVDRYGNELNIVIIIDNLPPVPVIKTEDGTPIETNSRINVGFRVSCDEDEVKIMISFNGISYTTYDGALLSDEGTYTFKMNDRMNNITTFSITIDKQIDYTLKGSYIEMEGCYYSRTGITVNIVENYAKWSVENADGISFEPGERINIEGIYTVKIEDMAGNVITIVIVIDHTAPVPTVRTVSGKDIPLNGKTNESFYVSCEEKNVTMLYSDGSSNGYKPYSGQMLETAARYNFTLRDPVGNELSFSISMDTAIEFSVNGIYKIDGEERYISRSWLSIDVDEEYKRFDVISGDVDLIPGEKINIEGEYVIEIEDSTGNTAIVVLVIDKTAPDIKLDGVEPGKITNKKVIITVNDYFTAYYRESGQEEQIPIVDKVTIEADGYYTVVAKDLAGNESVISFQIDLTVDAKLSKTIFDGQIISDNISFAWNEEVSSVILIKDGVSLQYRTGIVSEPGTYSLTATDKVGNEKTWTWTIMSKRAQSYTFSIPSNWDVVNVLCDDHVVSDVVQGDKIVLTQTGNYLITFENLVGAYTLDLTVDTIAPTVEITQEKTQIVIGSASKDNVTYQLMKDGKEVNFDPGQAISENGDYVLIVTDDLGNSTTYTFSLNYINASGIVVIVLTCLVAIGIIGIILYSRAHQRIR